MEASRISFRPRLRIWVLLWLVALAALLMKTPTWYRQAERYWRLKPSREAMDRAITLHVPKEAGLEGLLKAVRQATVARRMPGGLPIYVDPVGLQEAKLTMSSPLAADIDVTGVPTKSILERALKPLRLGVVLREGLLEVTSLESLDLPLDE